MVATHNNPAIPHSLRGMALIEPAGLPRFWPEVWASFVQGNRAQSTLKKQLTAVERFYRFADNLLGVGGLDVALATFDVEVIGQALEAYFLARQSTPGANCSEESWQAVLRFLREILTRIAGSSWSPPSLPSKEHLLDRLTSFERLHGSLNVSKRRRPMRVRSLPAEVVEALYELLDPESPRNPFRDGSSRWRVYIIFILLLHQGLRRGELLCMSSDAINCAFDNKAQRDRFWLTVRLNRYEEDRRSSTPSIKTPDSVRQLPLSEQIVRLVDEYAANYRGRPKHSFLINSQRNLPMSTENVTSLFKKITSALPKPALKVLEDRYGDTSITAHDLRHTCAVLRLNQILNAGVSMEEAMQQLRSFFGWSRTSKEPLRYARAVFEDRLSSVWKAEFDERVEVLRNLARI
jgi:site-specific recombinase XerD